MQILFTQGILDSKYSSFIELNIEDQKLLTSYCLSTKLAVEDISDNLFSLILI